MRGRSVFVKRIRRDSIDDVAAANTEVANHLALEKGFKRILRFHIMDYDDEYIYLNFERWFCTLGELVRVAAGLPTPSLTIQRRDEVEELLRHESFWNPSTAQPTPLLINLFKECIIGVSGLHEANFLHRDISVDSFFVLQDGDELYSLLGNLGISKNMKKSTGNVAVQKRVAPEQKHPVTPVEGFCNDIFYVGLSLGFAITKGVEVCNDDGVYSAQAEQILLMNPEARYFVRSLTQIQHTERPTAKLAQHQPLFWSSARTLKFYNRANQLIIERVLGNTLRVDLQTCSARVLGMAHPNWFSCLEPVVQNELKTERRYGHNTFSRFIRLVRNFIEHPPNSRSPQLEVLMGSTDESVLNYFKTRFPQLLVGLYELFRQHFPTEAASFILSTSS